MKLAVLIRVYNRLEDLEINLSVIRNTWLSNEYDIFVVSNGASHGFALSNTVKTMCKNTLELATNAGHLKGSSQLLIEGLKMINLIDYDFFIILEADTWLYGDKIIQKYTKKLIQKKAVWASARWYDRYYSLATDFAIIATSFLHENSKIFDFEEYPECAICNYLIDRQFRYVWIRENMNVMTPSYIKSYPFAPRGRFYSFPKSQMVTHHVEDVSGGMQTKQQQFNSVAKTSYFLIENNLASPSVWLLKLAHFTDKLLLRRSWYSKREKKNLEKN